MLKAKANGAWSAAKGANELLAKLTGHIIERRDMRVIRSVKDLTDEELATLASVPLEDDCVDEPGRGSGDCATRN